MGIHNNSLIGSSGQQGYQISRSVRLRNSSTGYFTRVAGTPTSQNVWTISMWVKLGNMMASNGTPNGCFFGANQAGNPNESIKWNGPAESGASQIYYQSATSGGTHNLTRFIVNNFRDPSAWYHLIFQKNASAASGTGCFLAWVNGVAVTFTGGYTGTQASVPNYINVSGSTFNIGAVGAANSLDAYLAEINFVDGQALTPSSFGETNAITGVWQPKKYAGTYGTNGFYLNFSDNSAATAAAIGKDSSGNGNNFTPSAGISVTADATYDSMLDVPTPYVDGGNGRGNYAVLNPVNATSAAGTSLSNGNLRIVGIGTGNANAWIGTLGTSSGKWYYEVVMGENNGVVGISQTGNPNTYPGEDATSYGYSTALKYNNNISTAYGASLTGGDIVGVAYDLDAGTITFYKNNVSQGQAFSGLSGTYFPAVRAGTTGAAVSVNFGQQPFTYTPPTGFKALNTQNLPASTIFNGANQFAATTYTGTGAAMSVSNAVNGKSFQPDWIWIKQRNNIANHLLADSVRGVSYYIHTSLANQEAAATVGTGITAVGNLVVAITGSAAGVGGAAQFLFRKTGTAAYSVYRVG